MYVEEPKESDLNETGTAPRINHENAKRNRGLGFGLILTVLLAMSAIGWFVYKGINTRVSAEKALVIETHDAAYITVAVTHPKVTGATQQLVLPGNTQPLIDAPVYARTNGYLKKWYADIGTRVKAGDLLAEIETPEVDHQLPQARADLETAQANLNLARITADRMVNLEKKGAVARQDADNVVGDMNSKKAIVDSAAANVKRLEDLQSYEKVYAPFDGVITARNTDIGALIDAGSAGGTQTALFQIAQPGVLRVYVNVPEAYSQAAKVGLTADLVLSEFPGKRFQGKLVRTAEAID